MNDGSAGSKCFVRNYLLLFLLECGIYGRRLALSLDPKPNVNHSETFEKCEVFKQTGLN